MSILPAMAQSPERGIFYFWSFLVICIMKKAFLIFFLLPLCGIAQNEKILYLPAHLNSVEIVSYISYFEDTLSKFNVDQVLKYKNFIASNGKLAFGLSTSSFWLKFKLHNSGDTDNFILRLQDPGIDQILVYQSSELIADVGDKYPFYCRKIIDKRR